MAVSCIICNTKCIWCNSGKCKWCKLPERAVKITNNIVLKHWLLNNKDVLNNLIRLAKINQDEKYLEVEMYNLEAIPEPEEIVVVPNWYCQYPEWSANKWAWVECINCGENRFRGWGKLCKWQM